MHSWKHHGRFEGQLNFSLPVPVWLKTGFFLKLRRFCTLRRPCACVFHFVHFFYVDAKNDAESIFFPKIFNLVPLVEIGISRSLPDNKSLSFLQHCPWPADRHCVRGVVSSSTMKSGQHSAKRDLTQWRWQRDPHKSARSADPARVVFILTHSFTVLCETTARNDHIWKNF